MRLFKNNNSGFVTIEILHSKPNYPKGVRFSNNYKVKDDPVLDLKTIFYQAFMKAHPDWPILEINITSNC